MQRRLQAAGCNNGTKHIPVHLGGPQARTDVGHWQQDVLVPRADHKSPRTWPPNSSASTCSCRSASPYEQLGQWRRRVRHHDVNGSRSQAKSKPHYGEQCRSKRRGIQQ